MPNLYESDLDLMVSELNNDVTLKDVQIANHDASDEFFIPNESRSRNSEIKTLRLALDKVALGASELISISGSAGTGKHRSWKSSMRMLHYEEDF